MSLHLSRIVNFYLQVGDLVDAKCLAVDSSNDLFVLRNRRKSLA